MAYQSDPFGMGMLGFASFVNSVVIRHPCLVLRRQCQVHSHAHKLHLTPVTLVPAIFNVVNKDGLLSLWKGTIGCGVLWAISRITEVLVADIFALPRTILSGGSNKRFWRHILLKAISYLATTPFIISSFIETVRSGARADDSRLLDVVSAGIERLRFDFRGARDNKRFAIFYLVIPTVGVYSANYIISTVSYDAIHSMAKHHVMKKLPSDRTRFHSIMPELFSSMASTIIADCLCYPLETVLHRLYIQGTRTLVDNLDTGFSAISIGTRYRGIWDCTQSIVQKEGVGGLFAGVGAIALQGALQFSVLMFVRMMFDYVENIGRGGPTRKAFDTRGPTTSSDDSSPFLHQSATHQFAVDLPSTSHIRSTPFNFPSFEQTQQQFGPASDPPRNLAENNFGPFLVPLKNVDD